MAPRTPFDNDEDRGAPLDPKDRLLREAKERFKRAQDWEGGWRKLYIDDVKFANGDSDNGWQWPDAVKEDRDANNRPCLTINKTKTIITKLANEAKKNPPEPRIKPVGDKGSYEAALVWVDAGRRLCGDPVASRVDHRDVARDESGPGPGLPGVGPGAGWGSQGPLTGVCDYAGPASGNG